MANESEMMAKSAPVGPSWVHVVAGSLVSGAVSAGFGYWLATRPKASCSCKNKGPSGNGNGNGNGGEKAA